MIKRAHWGTRFGFYLAAIGSACGLGNLWRFPYVVGENGGGAFVLMYVFFAMVVGLPLLIGELMLGQSTKRSVLTAISALTKKKEFLWVGRLCILLSLVVLAYYAVISGWVMHFLTQFLLGVFSSESLSEKGGLQVLLSSGWLQMGLASVHLILVTIIVLKGVQEGLEKWIGYMMPVFAILLITLMFRSLSLSAADEAIRFLFYPDFSKLTLSSPIHAIGHVCFTLSVGFGCMVTFGSYLRDEEHVPTAGFRVTIVDTILSLFSGLLIFSIVLQASDKPLMDPGLLFETLPRFLLQMRGGVIFGLAFFICLYLAALAASIGLLEVAVSNIVDRMKIKRNLAAWGSAVITLVIGLLPALSSSTFKHIKFHGRGLLEILDSLLINWLLPLIALGLSFVITHVISSAELEKRFIHSEKIESVSLFPYWLGLMKWIIPSALLIALLLQVIDFFF